MDDAVKDILHEWKYETITLKQLTKELRLNGFKVNSREVSKAIQRLLKNGKALRIGKRTIKLFKR
ncbi:MAG: hypothetical protein H5T45_01450 [Thermoplasmatales archaeon]|nr:hypothetical protein [Thermoplasmatales archaeon]